MKVRVQSNLATSLQHAAICVAAAAAFTTLVSVAALLGFVGV